MSFPKAPQQGRGGVRVEPRQVSPESGTKGPSGEMSFSGLPLWPYVFLLCSSLLNSAMFPQFVCSYKSLLPQSVALPRIHIHMGQPSLG